ncbi:hypothetical protein BJ322DRAFT_1090917 [Thelephora terrestris]|uniref:Uncharacterized protein n=1 Tax=Thelephora terrestris TaxID=56493 RepID=A0A9P6L1X8_9AGAM|nr:hypothetical protein BJ322DRAFT_1090917 [Thelephora terrestris]
MGRWFSTRISCQRPNPCYVVTAAYLSMYLASFLGLLSTRSLSYLWKLMRMNGDLFASSSGLQGPCSLTGFIWLVQGYSTHSYCPFIEATWVVCIRCKRHLACTHSRVESSASTFCSALISLITGVEIIKHRQQRFVFLLIWFASVLWKPTRTMSSV